MTDTTTRRMQDTAYAPSGRPQPTGWVGMVLFAAVMLMMLGSFQAVEGLVALFRDDFYMTTQTGLILQLDYTAYGWTHLILGLVAVATGIGLLAGQTWARIIGVIIAGVSALVNLAFLPAYPIWSVLVIALDVLVIYALTAHGREVEY